MIDALKRFYKWLTRVDVPVIPPRVFGTDAVHAWMRELRSDD